MHGKPSLFYSGWLAYELILFLGGIGTQRYLLENLSLILAIYFLFATVFYYRSFKLPGGFYLYLMFLLILFLNNLFYGGGNFEFTRIFLTGGLVWLGVYNSRDFTDFFLYGLLILGIFYGLLFTLNKVAGEPFKSSFSLFASTTLTHNNIGNLWAVILLFTVKINKKGLNIYLLSLLGTFFVIVSFSRSAVLTAAFGILYLYRDGKEFLGKKKNITVFVAFALIFIFMFAGVFKSIFRSRFMYIEKSVESIISYPAGIGVGNFGYLFLDGKGLIQKGLGYTSYTHNIITEFIVGMGYLSIPFIIWFIAVPVKNILTAKSAGKKVYAAALLGLSINFMTDYTYIIMTFLIIWFSLIAITDKNY